VGAARSGYGKVSQDWSYLTPKRSLYTQHALITVPTSANIPDQAIIDTTVVGPDGKPTSRARNQTLVIYVTGIGAATMPIATTELWLWVDSTYDERACSNAQTPKLGDIASSSSNWRCPDIIDSGDIVEADKWALIEVGKHNAAANNIPSAAFVFPWLPAGRYKAALASGVLVAGSGFIISEQHTE